MNKIITKISEMKDFDLLLFSEAYLHGFDGLNWDYDHDVNSALNQDSDEINIIKNACKINTTAVGFGYFERVGKDIYCSYMVINNKGEIVNNYRRLSIGWKEYTKTNSNYKEGVDLIPFEIEDLRVVTVLCGDLWDDSIKNKLLNLIKANRTNIIFWPNHLDYKQEAFDSAMMEYADRTKEIDVAVLLINDHSKTSYGGAVVFQQGKIIKQMKSGTVDTLVWES
jgi:N-carbamoylputrescine amidase